MRTDDGETFAKYGEVAAQLLRLIDCVNSWRDETKPEVTP